MWTIVLHAWDDGDERREVELAVLLSGDGDVCDVRLAGIGPDGHYRPLPPGLAETLDYGELAEAALAYCRSATAGWP